VTDKTIKYYLGVVVRALREKHNLSQEKLAELAQLHTTYVSLIGRGKRSPTIETVDKLAKALGTESSKLIAAAEKVRAEELGKRK
jgi:transcriptional regulator with XRE-family HTH domain